MDKLLFKVDELLNKMREIQKDKLEHFFWGALLSFIFVSIWNYYGALIILIIAFLIEVIDFIESIVDNYKFNYKASVLDILFTIIPTILFLLVKNFS